MNLVKCFNKMLQHELIPWHNSVDSLFELIHWNNTRSSALIWNDSIGKVVDIRFGRIEELEMTQVNHTLCFYWSSRSYVTDCKFQPRDNL